MIRYPDFRPPVNWNGRLNRATPQYNGLVGLYSPLSGGVRDLTQYANHASFVNQAAATGLNAVTGGNYIFDGTNDAINIPDSTANSLSTMSIFAWVRFDNIASSRCLIRKGSQAGTDTTWLWYWSISGTRLCFFAGTEKTIVWTPTTGVWYHLGVSINSTDVYHFVNGDRYISTAGTQPSWTDDADPLIVGEWSSYDFNGGMADIRIYNRVFGESEARSLYDLDTRWELYRPVTPQIWWIPPSATASIIPLVMHHRRQQAMS